VRHIAGCGFALVLGILSAGTTPNAVADETVPVLPAINPLLAACLAPDDADGSVLACTTAIQSRQLLGDSLAAALFRRGMAQGRRGQLTAAANDFSAALRLTPAATDVLFARASAYGALKRHDLAIADYGAILKLAPGDADSLYRRAWSLAAIGRDEAAVADLSAVIAVSPGDIDALMDRGGLFLRSGKFDAAAVDFTAIIVANKAAAAAFYNRGRARTLGGDDAGAAKDFATAAKLRDDNPYAALRRYVSDARSGGADSHILAEATAKLAPGQWPAPILAALAGTITEPDLLASAVVEDAAIASRLDAEAHFYLGEAALAKKNEAAAKAHFAAAAEAEKTIPEAVDAGWRLKSLQ
jgi:lipoprotein NlpI